ncbi:hypothetical protein [Sphingosinithalassobacter sp. CS137]|uniref:hypothetical protein n=1 Tax=Sphingosinithalassobacter sp. CS137 TaxID=2762748 RepID=UPI00165EB78B|nr:hypothetical protein [Sphingosinithalassobacter sp. CS137]
MPRPLNRNPDRQFPSEAHGRGMAAVPATGRVNQPVRRAHAFDAAAGALASAVA